MQTSAMKLKTISDISRDIAQVFFASVFIGPLVSGSENLSMLMAGIFLAFIFWYLSVGLVGNE